MWLQGDSFNVIESIVNTLLALQISTVIDGYVKYYVNTAHVCTVLMAISLTLHSMYICISKLRKYPMVQQILCQFNVTMPRLFHPC